MKGIERGIDVGDESLRRQGGQQSLSVGPKIWRNLCTLSNANLHG